VVQCLLCSCEYADSLEDVPWKELPDDWTCPVCGATKNLYTKLQPDAGEAASGPRGTPLAAGDADPAVPVDYLSWDEILIRGYRRRLEDGESAGAVCVVTDCYFPI